MLNTITSPSIINIGRRYLALPLVVESKQVTVLVSEDGIALDNDTSIEFKEFSSKTPELEEMIKNVRPLDGKNGFVFGIPNEFWVTVTMDKDSLECSLRDRFNSSLLDSTSILTSTLS